MPLYPHFALFSLSFVAPSVVIPNLLTQLTPQFVTVKMKLFLVRVYELRSEL